MTQFSGYAMVWLGTSASREFQAIGDALEAHGAARPELCERDFGWTKFDAGVRRFVVPLCDKRLQVLASQSRVPNAENVARVCIEPAKQWKGFSSRRRGVLPFEGTEADVEAVQDLLVRLVALLGEPELEAPKEALAPQQEKEAPIEEAPTPLQDGLIELSTEPRHVAFISAYKDACRVQGTGGEAVAKRRKAFAAKGVETFLDVALPDGRLFPQGRKNPDGSTSWVPATADVARIEDERKARPYYSAFSLSLESLGLAVADLDTKTNPGVVAELAAKVDAFAGPGAWDALLSQAWVDKTKSHGLHLFLTAPTARRLKDSPTIRGLELKTSGAVPLAGSTLPDGRGYIAQNAGGVLSGGKVYEALVGLFPAPMEPVYEEKKEAVAPALPLPLKASEDAWDRRVGAFLDRCILPRVRADFAAQLVPGHFHSGAIAVCRNLGQFRDVMCLASNPITLAELLSACADHENPERGRDKLGLAAGRKDIEAIWEQFVERSTRALSKAGFIARYLPERPLQKAGPAVPMSAVETSRAVAFERELEDGIAFEEIPSAELERMAGETAWGEFSGDDWWSYGGEWQDGRQASGSGGFVQAFMSRASAGFYLQNKPKPVEFLFGSLPVREFGLIAGPPATGKGFFSLQLSACLACGKDFCGWHVGAPKRTLYLSAEDSQSVLHNRIHALGSLFSPAELELIGQNLFASESRFEAGGVERRVMPLFSCAGQGVRGVETSLAALEALIDGIKPDLIICDTFQHLCPGLEENGPQGGALCEKLAELARRKGIAVLATHHAKKDPTEAELVSSDAALGRALSQSVVRGSTTITGTARWVLNLAPLATSFARGKSLGLPVAPNAEDGSVVAVKVSKSNCGPREHQFFLRRTSTGFFEPIAPRQGGKEQDSSQDASPSPSGDSTEALAQKLVAKVAEAQEPVAANRDGVRGVLGCTKARADEVRKLVAQRGLLQTEKLQKSSKGNTLTIYVNPSAKGKNGPLPAGKNWAKIGQE